MVDDLEVQETIQDGINSVAQILTRGFKKTDMSAIAKQMASGELLEAYVEALNKGEDFIAQGGAYGSEEHQEIKKMQQLCEHWIAQRVLTLSGWKEVTTRHYRRKDK